MNLFRTSILAGTLITMSCLAGNQVISLDSPPADSSPRNDVLTVKEYKVPKGYLKIAGIENVPDKIGSWGMESGKAFTDQPSAVFIPSRGVIIARTTAGGHRVVAAHVRDVWKQYRESTPKKTK
jgi:hypothetical protein